MRFKKSLAVLLVLSMAFATLTACGKKDDIASNPDPAIEEDNKQPDEAEKADDVPSATSTPTPSPTPEPPRDLGGITIKVGDWYTTGQAEPKTAREQDQLAYREQLQEEHNFTLVQENIAGWGEYAELFITSTIAGDPAADIFIMDPAMVPEPLKQGLMYPLSDLPSFKNFEDKMWNKAVKESYTQNGKIYAFSEVNDLLGLGVYWNRRIFEEAGLDPDLPYDLQKSGEWTWDKMKELAIKLTKDTDNDGVTDIYGFTGWQREIVKAAVFSNGGDYVRFNPDTGRYENNQKSDEVLAAIQYAVDNYNEGLIAPQPEGGSFTAFIDIFKSGKAAMCPAEWYRHTDFANMEDDWGFVFHPKGPGPNAKLQTMYLTNPRVMPVNLDPQRADDVAFAYSKWVGEVPGYEEEERDLSYYYASVRDARAVEETIVPMLEGNGVFSLVYMIPGLSFKHGANEDGGGLGDISAIEIADAASANYEAIINDFYSED